MNSLLNTAVQAAHKASIIMVEGFHKRQHLNIEVKGAQDFVTYIDRQSEEAIVEEISYNHPEHIVLGEEKHTPDLSKLNENDFLWIIDPLDGTTNFIQGIPHFAVSIALWHQHRLQLGVIYNPITEDLYVAQRGQGAYLNQTRLHVRTLSSLDMAVAATGFPYRNEATLDRYLKDLKAVTPVCAGIRRMGAASLDLAYLAAGQFDIYWEYGLAPWDIAAGALLIEEAGGKISGLNNDSRYLVHGNTIAGSPAMHPLLLSLLKHNGPAPTTRERNIPGLEFLSHRHSK